MSTTEDPAQLRRNRIVLVVAVGALLLLGLVLPHIAVDEDTGYGRSLIPASFFFLNVQVGAFGPLVNPALLAIAFNLSYLGLALHQFGLLLAAVTFWVLYPEDLNRWMFRMLVIAGWMLTVSAPVVVVGRVLIGVAGQPALLGLAWLPALLGGWLVIWAARRARERVDRSWYVTRPELM